MSYKVISLVVSPIRISAVTIRGSDKQLFGQVALAGR